MKDKISQAIKRIRVASHIAERNGEKIVVCFSGGKDSQVTLDLVQRAGVPFRAVYNVTTIDHPLNVNFIRTNYPEVEFVHPPLNFWQLIEKKKMLPSIWKRFCCAYLKEYYGGVVRAIGVRREESFARQSYAVITSDRHGYRFMPIIDWKEWEVWEYIEQHNLPVNPCYDFGHRVGCMICPYAPARQIKERFDEYPNLRRLMLRAIRRIRENPESSFGNDFPHATDEQVLSWWANKDKKFLQPELDFEQ